MYHRVMLTSLLLLVASNANAQRLPVSLDLGLGLATARTGGVYREETRNGLAADANLAVRVRRAWSGTILVGLNANAQGPGPYTSICIVLPGGGCKPAYPGFLALAALGGWESPNARLRILTGPAYLRGDPNGGPPTWTPGWQGRIDAACVTVGPIAALASVRGTLIPRYRSDAFQLLAFGLGLRIGQ